MGFRLSRAEGSRDCENHVAVHAPSPFTAIALSLSRIHVQRRNGHEALGMATTTISSGEELANQNVSGSDALFVDTG